MFKKVFVAVTYHTIDERGKDWLYSTVEQIGGNNDLINEVEWLKRNHANLILVCKTKKEAQKLVEGWNNIAKETGLCGFAKWANKEYHEQERKAI